ncbi:hypothetical protein BJ170DRAFT_625050 [Xylariales sp. AK1849]|nr:hypothetical protein BJ170DRAFT_625050 [Xylariales sp. AK1849]
MAARIANLEETCSHPLLIVGILAEVERERHLNLVKSRVFELLQRVYAMSNDEKISETSELHRETISVDSWLKVTQLRTGLESWKVQLLEMITHIDALEIDVSRAQFHRSKVDDLDDIDWRPGCVQDGRRIKKRLLEIVCEYVEKIRECTMVIDGVTLATQLSGNQIGYQDAQATLRIASDTRQDSDQMRSIAILTMVFLPATFVSSLFSMSFFNWYPSNGEDVLSPYVWIYPVVTISITLIVIALWYRFIRKRRQDTSEKSTV